MLLIANTGHSADPSVWMIFALVAAVILLQVFGYDAWRYGYVGDWYSISLAVAVIALVVSADLQSVWLARAGFVTIFMLGVYGTGAWFRTPKEQRFTTKKRPPR